MKELQNFLTSQELIIIYVIIGVLILGTIIFFITKKTYNHRKRKQNTKELNKLVSEVHEKIEEDKINREIHKQVKEETLEPIPEIIEEKKEKKDIMEEKVDTLEEVNINPVQSLKPGILTPSNDILPVEIPQMEHIMPNIEDTHQADSFIEQLDEIEILEEESENNNINQTIPVEVLEIDTKKEPEIKNHNLPKQMEIEELEYEDEMDQTKAQEEIEKLTQELVNANSTVENIDLTNFEAEQEKNAIISLDEFLKLGDTLYEENEITQYQDEGNEPISLDDLEKRKQENLMMNQSQDENEEKQEEIKLDHHNQTAKLDDFYAIKKPANQRNKGTKFKSSPIISPVYGIENNESNKTMELENTADYDKLDEEIRKTNEFLSTLRELQEKLE